jgi:putative flippase GtrA
MLKKIFLLPFNSTLIRFLFIGLIGLSVDTISLLALRHFMHLMLAKIISYIIAFSVTWVFNRNFTFRSKNPKRIQEWTRYAFIYAVTGVLHVLLFAALVYAFPYLYQKPAAAVIITAIIIAFVNFVLVKRIAFQKPAHSLEPGRI